jgi:hypothetical protein
MIGDFTDMLKVKSGREIQVDEMEYHRRQKIKVVSHINLKEDTSGRWEPSKNPINKRCVRLSLLLSF